MKRYLMSIIIAILILTPVLLAGCTQGTELENRIASLETKLIAAESTIKALENRIEQLEERELTDKDILKALQGKLFFANVGPLRQGYFWVNSRVSIKVE